MKCSNMSSHGPGANGASVGLLAQWGPASSIAFALSFEWCAPTGGPHAGRLVTFKITPHSRRPPSPRRQRRRFVLPQPYVRQQARKRSSVPHSIRRLPEPSIEPTNTSAHIGVIEHSIAPRKEDVRSRMVFKRRTIETWSALRSNGLQKACTTATAASSSPTGHRRSRCRNAS